MMFILGAIIGIFLYIYIPKFVKKHFDLQTQRKNYEITFTLMYFTHPIETTKKGEYIRMKPISIRLKADDEEEAVKFTKEIIHDNIKIEIDSIEEYENTSNQK